MPVEPLTSYQKQERAFLYIHQQALGDVFGHDTVQQKLSNLEGMELDHAMADLMYEAVDQGRFKHMDYVNDALEKRYQIHGQDVPYSEWFAASFPQLVMNVPLAYVEEHLADWCATYADRHADYFDLQAGGYQYLHDVLAEPNSMKGAPTSLSLKRAIEWLARQVAKADVATKTTDLWDGLFCNGYTKPQLDALLTQLGLLNASSLAASQDASAGAWVGTILALVERKLLLRNYAALARALDSSYNKPVSERALQQGVNHNNSLHISHYNRALSLIGRSESKES
jgi:hypothetical protein